MIEALCRRIAIAITLATGLFLCACGGGEPTPQEGSETHFLVRCGGACPAGLECLCGVCTQPCSEAATCSALEAGASCVQSAARIAEQRCEEDTAPAFCDRSCLSDLDCQAVDPTRTCQSGFCRPAPSSPPGARVCMPAPLASDALVVLGDSFISLTAIAAGLEQRAVAAGAIAENEHFRSYASPWTSFLADNALSIGSEFEAAHSEGPPRVVVMDGGATDMLNNPCPSGATPECTAVKNAVRGAELLLQRIAEGGVEHVFYFFYPNPVGDPTLEANLNTLRPLVENACGRSPVACHWLDLRTVFAGHYDEYAGADGFVPTDAGADATAAAVWQLMQARCVAP
ncbi:MAG TPA: hypothetical protein VG937_39720 [Polyangiaceae bacterium]|nr:hypothetical protein [Polyangiaceae bacterium]